MILRVERIYISYQIFRPLAQTFRIHESIGTTTTTTTSTRLYTPPKCQSSTPQPQATPPSSPSATPSQPKPPPSQPASAPSSPSNTSPASPRPQTRRSPLSKRSPRPSCRPLLSSSTSSHTALARAASLRLWGTWRHVSKTAPRIPCADTRLLRRWALWVLMGVWSC
jgi:hypothetical protein